MISIRKGMCHGVNFIICKKGGIRHEFFGAYGVSRHSVCTIERYKMVLDVNGFYKYWRAVLYRTARKDDQDDLKNLILTRPIPHCVFWPPTINFMCHQVRVC